MAQLSPRSGRKLGPNRTQPHFTTMDFQSQSQSQLIDIANAARNNAYAPYSGYKVGAAVLDAAGNIWAACNVENVSYGLSICAERAALSRMVAEGSLEVKAVAVVTADGGMPCGMCLQSLLEFAEDPASTKVWTISDSGAVQSHTLHDLIPLGFVMRDLRRTE